MADAGTGTVDITNVVSALQSSFVTWGTKFAYADLLTVPGLGTFIALPIISSIAQYFIARIIGSLAGSAVMAAFFLNTAVRKASQAQDYSDAVNAKNSLPPTATDAEYAAAEQTEMNAFKNFVMVTN